jgi:tetratricopeptide (TPR) repeat protein
MKNRNCIYNVVISAVLLFLVFFLQGCASREEKRDSFFNKGVALYEAGQYQEAILELKNAIQLDPDFVEGHVYLGWAYLKQENVKKAYGALSKALTLDADLDDVRLTLGMILLRGKQGEEALDTITPLLEKNPAHPGALIIAAYTFLLARNSDKAIETLKKIDQTKGDKEVLLAFARAYRQRGDTQKVEEYLLRYQEAAPDDPISYLDLSRIYAEDKQLQKAEDEIRKLIERKKGDTSYPLLLCKFYLDTGQENKAQTEFERLIGENPRENRYILAYTEYLSEKKRHGQAQRLLREAVQNAPDSWKVRKELVDAYLADAKIDEALREVDDFLQRNAQGGNIDALAKKAQILTQLDRWEEAEKQCDMALATDPTNPDAHLVKGTVSLQKGDFDEAVVHLRQVIDTKPSESQGHLFLARALCLSGELSLAIEQLKAGLRILPKDVALRMELITYYQKQGEWEYALEAANTGLEQRPQDRLFLIQRGRMLTALEKPDQAEKVFKSIIDIQPEANTGYLELGRLKASAGDHAGAIPLFEKALHLEGDKATALKLLLDAYLETKQADKAEALCRKMLQQDPGDAVAAAELASIEFQQGKYQGAEKHFKAAIQASPYSEEPYRGLLAVYGTTHQLEEALALLKEIYSQDPESFRIGFTLCLLYEKLGQYETAISVGEALISKYPYVVALNKNLARLYAEYFHDSEGSKKALEYAHKALANAPDNPQVLDIVAWVELKLGRLSKALNYVTMAVNGARQDPIINYHAGVISAKMGKNIAARNYLSRAMELGLNEDDTKVSEHLLKTL